MSSTQATSGRPAASSQQKSISGAAGTEAIALRLLIITIARKCGISAPWVSLLEMVIDPLIQLLLPHVEAITVAVASLASTFSQA